MNYSISLEPSTDKSREEIQFKKHANFFVRFLKLLPPRVASHDSTRVSLAFFSVCGLDILDSLDLLEDSLKNDIIDWLYRLQIKQTINGIECSGFMGSSTLNLYDDHLNAVAGEYKWGHLAMTYTGIAILVTLGDNLKRLNRKEIIAGVAAVQRADGSFSASIRGSEHDMRFVYCAAAICNMLNDWGTVNKESMFNYIMNSIRYDFGVSQHFEMESHGGTTFCAIAALELSGQLNRLSKDLVEKIKRWLLFRQVPYEYQGSCGFQGRPNKPVDTCYSFWIGSSLRILGAFELSDPDENRRFIASTQYLISGGLSKWPGFDPDPYHSYFGLCGLSFLGEPGIKEIMPSLNISMKAYERLKQYHSEWRLSNTILNMVEDIKISFPLQI